MGLRKEGGAEAGRGSRTQTAEAAPQRPDPLSNRARICGLCICTRTRIGPRGPIACPGLTVFRLMPGITKCQIRTSGGYSTGRAAVDSSVLLRGASSSWRKKRGSGGGYGWQKRAAGGTGEVAARQRRVGAQSDRTPIHPRTVPNGPAMGSECCGCVPFPGARARPYRFAPSRVWVLGAMRVPHVPLGPSAP